MYFLLFRGSGLFLLLFIRLNLSIDASVTSFLCNPIGLSVSQLQQLFQNDDV